MVEWPREVLTDFIELYRNRPCLWLLQSDEYTNKNIKNHAYNELVELCRTHNLNVNICNVKTKIQNIRNAFRKETRKIEESALNGADADNVYTPSLWYYNLLLFTKDQDTAVPSMNSVTNEYSNSSPNSSPGKIEEEEDLDNNEECELQICTNFEVNENSYDNNQNNHEISASETISIDHPVNNEIKLIENETETESDNQQPQTCVDFEGNNQNACEESTIENTSGVTCVNDKDKFIAENETQNESENQQQQTCTDFEEKENSQNNCEKSAIETESIDNANEDDKLTESKTQNDPENLQPPTCTDPKKNENDQNNCEESAAATETKNINCVNSVNKSIQNETQNIQMCIRSGCCNNAINNPEWEQEFCSNDCVILHCRNVFMAWVKANEVVSR